MRDPERPVTPADPSPIRCPVCGREWPVYLVEGLNHEDLGCESCLTIKKDGVIQ